MPRCRPLITCAAIEQVRASGASRGRCVLCRHWRLVLGAASLLPLPVA
jgi:hypothetical protein